MVTAAPALAQRRRLTGGVADQGSRWDIAEHVALLALLGFWAVPFTKAAGGRGVHAELVFAALLIAVLIITRAWLAPGLSTIMAGLVAVTALLVCVFAPSGWYGGDVAAGYGIAAACYLVARRYVRDSARQDLIAAAICLASLYEFSQAFISWWGSENPATVMAGTFYWRNPYAAFLLPGAVIGLGLIATGRAPWKIIGWFSVPLCAAGIVFSSSRATLAVMLAGWLALAVAVRRERTEVKRLGGGVVAAVVVTAALPGPPLFPHYVSPFAAIIERSSGRQTLSHNGVDRLKFWWQALKVFVHHPVDGAGFHTLASASAYYTPSGEPRSPLAHNGFLQPFPDGGLLLGIPVLVAALVVLWWALRGCVVAFRRSDTLGATVHSPVLSASISIALVASLAHSAVDFDWSHPSLMIQTVLLAACVAPMRAQAPTGSDPDRTRRVSTRAILALGVLLISLILSVPMLHQWQRTQPNLRLSTATLLGNANAVFGDYRPAKALLSAYAMDERRLTSVQLQEALDLTSDAATVDLHLALLRQAVGAKSGLISNATENAYRLVHRVDGSSAPYVSDLALVLTYAGDLTSARELIAADIQRQVAKGEASPDLRTELSQWARTLGTDDAYACQLLAAGPLLDERSISQLPEATRSCTSHDQGSG